MAPKGNWDVKKLVMGATPSKEAMADDKNTKLGDEFIEVKGSEGGKTKLYRKNVSESMWENMVDQLGPPTVDMRESRSTKPGTSVAVDRVVARDPVVAVEKPALAPTRVIDPVVAPNGATQSQVMEGGTPGTYSTSDEVRDTVSAIGEGISQFTSPIKTIVEGVVNPGPAKQVPTDAGPPAAAAKAPGSEGGSASVSIRTPGGDPGMPKWDGPTSAETMELAMARGDAEAKKAKVAAFAAGEQAKAAEEIAQAERKKAEIEAQVATDEVEKRELQRQRMELFTGQFERLKAEQSKLDPTIDPNRYWKNKDAGQIALGAIAGALFGFAGKGMDYLTSIQNEIKMDVDAQKASYEQASDKIKQQMAAAGDDYARARQEGVSDAEARAVAAVARVASMKSYVQAATAHTASVEAQGKAMEAAAGLDAINLKYIQEGSEAATKNTSMKLGALAQSQQARAAMINANANATRASAAGGKKALPGSIRLKIAAAKRLIDTMKQMKESAKGGVLDKAGRGIKATLPGVTEGMRKEGAISDDYELSKATLAIDVLQSSIQSHEKAFSLDKMPDRNSPLKDTDTFFDQRLKVAEKYLHNLENGEYADDPPADTGGE